MEGKRLKTLASIGAMVLTLSVTACASKDIDVPVNDVDEDYYNNSEIMAAVDELEALLGQKKVEYTFQAVEDDEKLAASSKIYNIIDDYTYYDLKFSLAYGKIKALFGQPIYETEDMDNLFSYCVLATPEDGDEVYLSIYCAGSGLAIGGQQDEESQKAAKALIDYIWQAEPIDYEYEAYYFDGPTVLEFGIKDGVPFYHEEELKPPKKESRELYEELSDL